MVDKKEHLLNLLKDINPQDLLDLISLLRRDREEINEPPEKIRTKRRTTKNSKNPKNNFLGMKFTAQEQQIFDKDRDIDKKLRANRDTPERNRMPDLVNVQCLKCGKEERVSSKIVPEDSSRYKCNKCSIIGEK